MQPSTDSTMPEGSRALQGVGIKRRISAIDLRAGTAATKNGPSPTIAWRAVSVGDK